MQSLEIRRGSCTSPGRIGCHWPGRRSTGAGSDTSPGCRRPSAMSASRGPSKHEKNPLEDSSWPTLPIASQQFRLPERDRPAHLLSPRVRFSFKLYRAHDGIPLPNRRLYCSSRSTPAFGICLPHRKRGQDLVDGCCAVVREPKLACFSRTRSAWDVAGSMPRRWPSRRSWAGWRVQRAPSLPSQMLRSLALVPS